MNTDKKRTGQSANSKDAKSFKDNEIYALLIEKLPDPYVRPDPVSDGKVLDTLRLAKDLKVSRFTVYRFLNDEKLSKKIAKRLIGLPDTTLENTDLLPYLMNF